VERNKGIQLQYNSRPMRINESESLGRAMRTSKNLEKFFAERQVRGARRQAAR
jgi:hypothetical protein